MKNTITIISVLASFTVLTIILFFFPWRPLPETPKVIASTVQNKKLSSLENRFKTLEALYMALNQKVESVKNRPDIRIERATIYNGEGEIIIVPMRKRNE